MFTETLTTHDDVVGIACEGKMTHEDFERMHVLLHERLGAGGKPGLVLDLTYFEGYEEASAMLEDIKIDTAHANDFTRVAVVGEDRWMDWGTSFVNVLTRSEMRWFDAGETETAALWARGL